MRWTTSPTLSFFVFAIRNPSCTAATTTPLYCALSSGTSNVRPSLSSALGFQTTTSTGRGGPSGVAAFLAFPPGRAPGRKDIAALIALPARPVRARDEPSEAS